MVGKAEQSATENTEKYELAKKAGSENVLAGQSKAEESKAESRDEFPFTVRFENGVANYLEGDEITIDEVRGTADTFKPGNKYLIKGTYKLHSHPAAQLSAYVTAIDRADGVSPVEATQTNMALVPARDHSGSSCR